MRNPIRAQIDGFDAACKLEILSRLAFAGFKRAQKRKNPFGLRRNRSVVVLAVLVAPPEAVHQPGAQTK
jgi:hypothetical protein